MEYKRVVQTVVETPTYLAIVNKLFSEEERADFERCGLHAKEWGKAVGHGLCISGATRDFRFF